MPNKETVKETVSENTKTQKPKTNPFCVVEIKVQADLGQRPIYKAVRVELDEKTHQTFPVIEPHDLVAEIQSCKDLAGVDYMKKLLLTGQAKPEDFYDDGESGIDTTIIPKTPNEALSKANELGDQIANLCKALGIKDGKELTQETLEEKLTQKIEQLWNAQAAKAAQTIEGGDK